MARRMHLVSLHFVSSDIFLNLIARELKARAYRLKTKIYNYEN